MKPQLNNAADADATGVGSDDDKPLVSVCSPYLTCVLQGWYLWLNKHPVLSRDLKSSRSMWPRGQNFGLSLGLKALASALASNFWPRPGLSLQQKNQQSRRDWPVCLLAAGHHTMIHVEGSYCARENEKYI